jgi:DNA-binding response OmpR family regulator
MKPTKAPTSDTTLLIVEDDILIAMTLQDVLGDAGYHVLDLTGRHMEAVSAAKASKPDLALVNIELQGRDDGIALARELKAMGIPSLFISGQISRARSAQSVAIGSLPKPYSPADMVMAVAYLLGRLKGDESLPRPANLEVFGEARDEVAPEVA